MTTGCEFYADALVELAAGRLESERAERVDAHLAGCVDCRRELAVILAVRGAPAPMPEGLEARLRAAVGGDERASPAMPSRGPAPAAPVAVRKPGGRRPWRALALPAAAAAAVAVWLGVGGVLGPAGGGSGVESADAVADYDPYGSWPAADGVVAGDLVLSELSVEELEALLEEMQS